MTTRHQAIAAVESRLVISTQTMTLTVSTTSKRAANVTCGQYSLTEAPSRDPPRPGRERAATHLQYRDGATGRGSPRRLGDHRLHFGAGAAPCRTDFQSVRP